MTLFFFTGTCVSFQSRLPFFLKKDNSLSKPVASETFSRIVVYPHLLLGFREYWMVVNPGLQYPSFILMILLYKYTLIIDTIGHHIFFSG